MIDLERTLGRPYASMPIGKWMYVHHIVKKATIDLLVVDKDGSRLYTIVNNKDKRNKLASSQERSEKGIPQEGEFKRKKTNLGKGTNNELELVMHDLPVPEHLRKDQ